MGLFASYCTEERNLLHALIDSEAGAQKSCMMHCSTSFHGSPLFTHARSSCSSHSMVVLNLSYGGWLCLQQMTLWQQHYGKFVSFIQKVFPCRSSKSKQFIWLDFFCTKDLFSRKFSHYTLNNNNYMISLVIWSLNKTESLWGNRIWINLLFSFVLQKKLEDWFKCLWHSQNN